MSTEQPTRRQSSTPKYGIAVTETDAVEQKEPPRQACLGAGRSESTRRARGSLSVRGKALPEQAGERPSRSGEACKPRRRARLQTEFR